MSRPRPRPMPRGDRLMAWVVTGPVGHLWAGMVDWLALGVRFAWARARRREVRWWE